VLLHEESLSKVHQGRLICYMLLCYDLVASSDVIFSF